jgi:uncharacterized membrane protein
MRIISHHKHATNITQSERWLSGFCGGWALAAGVFKRNASGLALTLAGADLIRRGLTGHSYLYEWLGIRTAPKGQGAETTAVPYELGIRVDESIVINRPRAQVFRFWRHFENLSRFMENVRSVRRIDPKTSHWIVKAPAGRTAEWDAVVHNEIPDRLIAWRTLPGAGVDHAGSVWFKDAPRGGTEVVLELQYNPPADTLGAAFAALWGAEPGMQIQQDLRRLKHIMESGDFLPHTLRDEEVDEASEMSFPASDAPAYGR